MLEENVESSKEDVQALTGEADEAGMSAEGWAYEFAFGGGFDAIEDFVGVFQSTGCAVGVKLIQHAVGEGVVDASLSRSGCCSRSCDPLQF